jgi:hypothetical protein
LDESAVSVVTDDGTSDIGDLGWDYADLLAFVVVLRPYSLSGEHDFKNAQWCKGSAGDWYPCDAYAASFDPVKMCRDANGPKVYVKFSIPDDGTCLLITVSAHD